MNLVLVCDGASSGNGGACGAGVVLYDEATGKKIDSVSEYLGDGTNTFAECMAIVKGITWMVGYMQNMEEPLRAAGDTVSLTILSDSVLVVNMINDKAKPRKDGTKRYLAEIMSDLEELKAQPGLKEVVVKHVGRDFTHEADSLAQEVAQSKQHEQSAAQFPFLNPKK